MHLFVYKRDTELLPARFRSVCAPTYHMQTHTHTHTVKPVIYYKGKSLRAYEGEQNTRASFRRADALGEHNKEKEGGVRGIVEREGGVKPVVRASGRGIGYGRETERGREGQETERACVRERVRNRESLWAYAQA